MYKIKCNTDLFFVMGDNNFCNPWLKCALFAEQKLKQRITEIRISGRFQQEWGGVALVMDVISISSG